MILTILGFLFSVAIALSLFWIILLAGYVFFRYILPIALVAGLAFWGASALSDYARDHRDMPSVGKGTRATKVCQHGMTDCVIVRY